MCAHLPRFFRQLDISWHSGLSRAFRFNTRNTSVEAKLETNIFSKALQENPAYVQPLNHKVIVFKSAEYARF